MTQNTRTPSNGRTAPLFVIATFPLLWVMPAAAQSHDADDGRGLGINWRPDVGEDPYLQYAAEPQFASVVGVRLWDVWDPAFVDRKCSGTVLDTTTVLTAAHCLPYNYYLDVWASQWMLLWPRDERKMVWVEERIGYPEFDFLRGGATGGFDIALLKLGGRGAYSIAKAELNPDQIPLGTVVTQVGEGASGPMDDPGFYGVGAGVLRAADNVFDAWTESLPNTLIDLPPVNYSGLYWNFSDNGVSYYTPSQTQLGVGRVMAYDYDHVSDPGFSFFGDSSPLPMEGGGASGDSGGPLFAQDDDGWKIVGVFAGWWNKPDFGAVAPGGYGSMGINTAVSPFAQWIADYQNESVWDEDADRDADYDDPMNWWTEGERAVPDASMNIVFRLPRLSHSGQWNPGVIEPRWNEQVVRLHEDRQARRLRVRRGSGITIDLGGHQLTLTNESDYTTAIQVGYDHNDWPILRLQNGVCLATDISIAEFGKHHYDGNWNMDESMTWTRGEVHLANVQMQVDDSVYLGERKAPITNSASYRYRPPPGWGILNVTNNSRLTVGSMIKIGRGVESAVFGFSRPGFDPSYFYFGLCGELHVSDDSAVIIGASMAGEDGWVQIGTGGVLECTGLIFADILNQDGVFEVVDRYPNFNVGYGSPLIWRGRTKITGDFVQAAGGRSKFSVSGPVAYEDFDRLEVSGQVQAGGTLEVEFDQGFVPVGGDRFELISASSVTGEFDSIVALGLPAGMTATAEYDAGSLTIQVVACLADLNQDGRLDFFDVSAFMAAFNQQNPAADFNGDGAFDFFDVSSFLQAFNAGCP